MSNTKIWKGFSPLYRLSLFSFAWLMTGILQVLSVCMFSDQVQDTTQDQVTIKICGRSYLFAIPFHVPSNHSPLILSYLPRLHNLFCNKDPSKQLVHTKYDSFSTLMLTWLKLGWEEYRLWVQSEWLDMVHVESGLSYEVGGKKEEESKSRH